MAYATKMAAALSGATVSQLRHWRSPRTGPLLAPEIAATPRAVYSFQDAARVRRLADPPPTARWLCHGLALAALTLAIAAASALVPVFAVTGI